MGNVKLFPCFFRIINVKKIKHRTFNWKGHNDARKELGYWRLLTCQFVNGASGKGVYHFQRSCAKYFTLFTEKNIVVKTDLYGLGVYNKKQLKTF